MWSVFRRLRTFVDLARGFNLGAAVELGHQENLAAITAGERLAHALFAYAAVVVPAIVEEVDAAIDCLVHEPDRFCFAKRRHAEVVAAEADSRHALACAAEFAIDHAVRGWRSFFRRHQGRERSNAGGCRSRFNKFATLHETPPVRHVN